MRKIFTLATAMLCGAGAIAQNSNRLISRSNFVYDGTGYEGEDSTIYKYTGTNGFDNVTKGWLYDSTIIWTWDKTTSSWNDNGRSYQTLNAGQILSQKERKKVGSTWQDYNQVVYTYSNGLVESYVYSFNMGSGLQPMSKELNTYNSSKQLTGTTMQSWNIGSSSWDNSSRQSFHFNSAGQVDTMWSESWVSGAWKKDMRTVNVYAAGLLVSSMDQGLSASGWVDVSRTTHTHNAQNFVATTVKETWDPTTSAWVNAQRFENDYNTSGDMTEQKFAGWVAGGWQYGTRFRYNYNSNHQVLTEDSYSWDAAANAWYQAAGFDRFRRNIYGSTTDVPTVNGNAAGVDIYPAPAADNIFLAVTFRQAQPVVVKLMDMNGRVLKQLTDHAGTQYRWSVNVADLPAGNYMINISGTTEVASKMITVGN